MALDIFAPQVSTVSYDLSGKTLLIYGTNRTGKTKQLTKLPKPCYLAFEAGINGISGVPFFPMRKWSDFVSFVRQITKESNMEKAKEMYQTIILDEASVCGRLCSEFICEKWGAESIGSANNGFGLWKEYSQEFEKQLILLTSVGFTCAFIAHEGTRDFKDEKGEVYSKIYPAGDKRIIDPICNLVDIIGYAAVNGVDENGAEIKSSLYLVNTKRYHAGSRFDYLKNYLSEFTAEGLQQAMKEAIEEEERVSGMKAVDYNTQQQSYKRDEKSYDELKEEIKQFAMKLYEEDETGKNNGDKYIAIVEEHLGKGNGVQDTSPSQKQLLELIVEDLKEMF